MCVPACVHAWEGERSCICVCSDCNDWNCSVSYWLRTNTRNLLHLIPPSSYLVIRSSAKSFPFECYKYFHIVEKDTYCCEMLRLPYAISKNKPAPYSGMLCNVGSLLRVNTMTVWLYGSYLPPLHWSVWTAPRCSHRNLPSLPALRCTGFRASSQNCITASVRLSSPIY